MKIFNKIYAPFVLSAALALGIVVGNFMGEQKSMISKAKSVFSTTGKLDYILKDIDKNYVDTVSIDSLTEKMIPILLKELDPHSIYIPAKDLESANEELQGNFGGVGIQFRIFDDTVMVMHVVEGGPSQKVGLKDGDRVISVNDSIIAGVNMKNDDVMELLRGKFGTNVKVGVYRPSTDQILDFDIRRGNIPVESVEVSYMLNDKTGLYQCYTFWAEYLQ